MDQQGKHRVITEEAFKLSKFIASITSKYSPNKKPLLIGASQGGDLSYFIALKYPQHISAAFPLLATLDEQLMQEPLEVNTYPPIRVYHGKEDAVVKIENVKNQTLYLEENNVDVELNIYENCGHQITDQMKAEFKKEITKLLKG